MQQVQRSKQQTPTKNNDNFLKQTWKQRGSTRFLQSINPSEPSTIVSKSWGIWQAYLGLDCELCENLDRIDLWICDGFGGRHLGEDESLHLCHCKNQINESNLGPAPPIRISADTALGNRPVIDTFWSWWQGQPIPQLHPRVGQPYFWSTSKVPTPLWISLKKSCHARIFELVTKPGILQSVCPAQTRSN